MKRTKTYETDKSVLLPLACAALTLLYALDAARIPATARPRTDAAPTVAAVAPPAANAPYSRRASQDALKWADAELRRMSLDEKIGQLISVGVNARFLNQESDEYRQLLRQVEQNHVGGIILFRGPVYESTHLMNRMQQRARRPLLISADLEAGAGMRFDDTVNFPWNMAVGATGDPEYARRQGEVTAREARALGIQQLFAPVSDVNNNAANPVINVRSYGEDPEAVARFVVAFTEGAQKSGVIATAKHFPGHGDTSIDSHRGLPVINVNRARLDRIELIPFRAAIAAGVGSVMSAHIGLPEIDPTIIKPLPRDAMVRPTYVDEGGEIVDESAYLPGTLSPVVLGGLLRRDLGFDGIVVTDAMDMAGLTIYFKPDEAAVRAVLAGADMLLKPGDPDACVRGLREAVRSGRLTERRIEDSARRILAAKYGLGLVRERLAPLEEIDRAVSSPQAERLADEVAGRAITLVRDEGKLIQTAAGGLRPNARIFNLAITNGDDRFFIANPFVSAMARAGRRMDTVVLDYRSTDEEVKNALERAGKADVVIASMYGRVRSGASNSVGLPEQGTRVLSQLLARKIPVVGVSFGNPYLLSNFPALGTYVVAYGDMPSLQRAAARALLGRADVTGRLPITLPGLYPRGTGIQLKASTNRAALTSK
ncbi:MAG TPA: glycoside hydrolase family 3 N-terminal domain-containing protein [Pyrinomonadaceae bacterium]|jgi:beta-N-acetylhexosaminidase|nr:glycoside hydrolase family 3 N-terminal domain-containing protein [Pyrinomonadaceae bacterium]